MIPIPSEQLYHPVRVCDDCFTELVRTKKSLITPEDNVEQSVAVDNDNTNHDTNGLNNASEEEPITETITEANQEAF